VVNIASIVDILLGVYTVIAATLTAIGVISYRRSSSGRVLFVTLAFFLLFLKGLILILGLYVFKAEGFLIPSQFGRGFATLLAIDSVAMLALYFALFHRR